MDGQGIGSIGWYRVRFNELADPKRILKKRHFELKIIFSLIFFQFSVGRLKLNISYLQKNRVFEKRCNVISKSRDPQMHPCKWSPSPHMAVSSKMFHLRVQLSVINRGASSDSLFSNNARCVKIEPSHDDEIGRKINDYNHVDEWFNLFLKGGVRLLQLDKSNKFEKRRYEIILKFPRRAINGGIKQVNFFFNYFIEQLPFLTKK